MSSATAIIQEMRHASDSVRAQAAMNLPGFDVDAMRKAKAKALIVKIKNLRTLPQSQVPDLITAISSSVFVEDERAKIAEAIHAKDNQCAAPPSVASMHGSGAYWNQQKFATPSSVQNYYIKGDHVTLNNPSLSLDTTVSCATNRVSLCGLHRADEATMADIATVVVCAQWPHNDGEYTEYHDVVKRVKASFAKSSDKSCPLDFISDYPADPKDLPEAHFAAAYEGSDGPVLGTIANWTVRRKEVASRGNNKILQTTRAVTATPATAGSCALAQWQPKSQPMRRAPTINLGQASSPPNINVMQTMADSLIANGFSPQQVHLMVQHQLQLMQQMGGCMGGMGGMGGMGCMGGMQGCGGMHGGMPAGIHGGTHGNMHGGASGGVGGMFGMDGINFMGGMHGGGCMEGGATRENTLGVHTDSAAESPGGSLGGPGGSPGGAPGGSPGGSHADSPGGAVVPAGGITSPVAHVGGEGAPAVKKVKLTIPPTGLEGIAALDNGAAAPKMTSAMLEALQCQAMCKAKAKAEVKANGRGRGRGRGRPGRGAPWTTMRASPMTRRSRWRSTMMTRTTRGRMSTMHPLAKLPKKTSWSWPRHVEKACGGCEICACGCCEVCRISRSQGERTFQL